MELFTPTFQSHNQSTTSHSMPYADSLNLHAHQKDRSWHHHLAPEND